MVNEQKHVQSEVSKFEDRLNEYGGEMFFLGNANRVDSQERKRTRQALLDHVAGLEARISDLETLAGLLLPHASNEPSIAEDLLKSEVVALKAREARFIRHCDALSAAFKDVVNHAWAKDSENLIMQIVMEYPDLQLATILNPGTDWYHLTQDQILDEWLNARISEGLASHLLDVGRVQARTLMENKHGVNWRDYADETDCD